MKNKGSSSVTGTQNLTPFHDWLNQIHIWSHASHIPLKIYNKLIQVKHLCQPLGETTSQQTIFLRRIHIVKTTNTKESLSACQGNWSGYEPGHVLSICVRGRAGSQPYARSYVNALLGRKGWGRKHADSAFFPAIFPWRCSQLGLK